MIKIKIVIKKIIIKKWLHIDFIIFTDRYLMPQCITTSHNMSAWANWVHTNHEGSTYSISISLQMYYIRLGIQLRGHNIPIALILCSHAAPSSSPAHYKARRYAVWDIVTSCFYLQCYAHTDTIQRCKVNVVTGQ